MTLREWIVKEGGVFEASKVLNVNPVTLRSWMSARRAIDIYTMVDIERATGGRVTYTEIIDGWFSELGRRQKAKFKKTSRRIRGGA